MSASATRFVSPVCKRDYRTRAYRTAKRAELPVENADHAILRRVEDEVVELVVAMHDSHASFALVWQVPLIPRDELAPTGDFPHQLSGIDILNRGLRECDLGKGLDLTREVRLVRAEVLQADVLRVERGERAQRAHRGEPAVYLREKGNSLRRAGEWDDSRKEERPR